MPKRTRTHRLENISIQRFEQQLPEAWVCRRKGDDYGIDLEVEVFDENGESTGLLFYVQLKATDDVAKERSVNMKVDRIEYLASFDSPSIVVRYCSGTDMLHWMWVSNIFANNRRPSTKTLTVQFEKSDAWLDTSPREIVQTLNVYRTIRHATRTTPIGISIGNNANSETVFELKHAVAKVRDLSRMVIASTDPTKCLPVTISLDEGNLVAQINVISSISVQLESLEREQILEQLVYILAYMAGRYEFVTQANDLAKIISENQFVCQSRELASGIACSVMNDVSLSRSVAKLNSLYEMQDGAFAMYIQCLIASDASDDSRQAAIKEFLKNAISAHSSQSLRSQAALHYSLGNHLYMSGDYRLAIREYNFARRKHPKYCETDYFLAEFAASLYFQKRYHLSSHLYSLSHGISQRPKTAICAGDAFLFAGSFEDAKKFFEFAMSSEDEFEAAEATTKCWLAEWALEFFELNKLLVKTSQLGQPTFWEALMNDCLEREELHHALGACLMLGFLVENEVRVWAKAIMIAAGTCEPSFIVATLSCAICRCGYDAYSPFRDSLASQGLSAEVLESYDQIADELYSTRTPLSEDKITIRILDDEQMDSEFAVSTHNEEQRN